MDLKRVFRRAKDAVDEHGGTEALKDDLSRARKAASQPGSVKDKAVAVREALTHKPEHAGDVDEVAPLAEDQPSTQAASQRPAQTPPAQDREAPPTTGG